MKHTTTAQQGNQTPTANPLDTEAFAAQSVRKRLCVAGSYFGITPCKLANRLLAWPAVQVSAEDGQ
jgi:hypothetical protein